MHGGFRARVLLVGRHGTNRPGRPGLQFGQSRFLSAHFAPRRRAFPGCPELTAIVLGRVGGPRQSPRTTSSARPARLHGLRARSSGSRGRVPPGALPEGGGHLPCRNTRVQSRNAPVARPHEYCQIAISPTRAACRSAPGAPFFRSYASTSRWPPPGPSGMGHPWCHPGGVNSPRVVTWSGAVAARGGAVLEVARVVSGHWRSFPSRGRRTSSCCAKLRAPQRPARRSPGRVHIMSACEAPLKEVWWCRLGDQRAQHPSPWELLASARAPGSTSARERPRTRGDLSRSACGPSRASVVDAAQGEEPLVTRCPRVRHLKDRVDAPPGGVAASGFGLASEPPSLLA